MPARSPLMSALQRALRAAATEAPAQVSRRDFLRGAAGVAGAGLLSACGTSVLPGGALARGLTGVRAAGAGGHVAIVGAGLAGLTAAYTLQNAGVPYTLYEASTRVGGRVYSARNLLGPGLVTELGAEFIDSDHKVMLGLARAMGIGLVDTHNDTGVRDAMYFFNGQAHDEQDLIAAIKPYFARLAHDQASLPDAYGYHNPGAWQAFDNLSLHDYLDRIGMSGWVRQLVETAYLTEMGLETREQSCLNLLGLMQPKVINGHFSLLGGSDERYKLVGGNQSLPEALARVVGDHLKRGHVLESVAPSGSGYALSFAQATGPAVQVQADAVILCVPFSVLRNVTISVPMPAAKQRAIQTLGYGTNAKLFLGFKRRVWRDSGLRGSFMADRDLQNGWDSSELQSGEAGSLTMFWGGRAGAAMGQTSPGALAAARLDALDAMFPGARGAFTGQAEHMLWPDEPFARGSYSCFRPGQFASFHGAEGEPVGRMFFAGEHCSNENQGYMEGAAETGLKAAKAAAKALIG